MPYANLGLQVKMKVIVLSLTQGDKSMAAQIIGVRWICSLHGIESDL